MSCSWTCLALSCFVLGVASAPYSITAGLFLFNAAARATHTHTHGCRSQCDPPMPVSVASQPAACSNYRSVLFCSCSLLGCHLCATGTCFTPCVVPCTAFVMGALPLFGALPWCLAVTAAAWNCWWPSTAPYLSSSLLSCHCRLPVNICLSSPARCLSLLPMHLPACTTRVQGPWCLQG